MLLSFLFSLNPFFGSLLVIGQCICTKFSWKILLEFKEKKSKIKNLISFTVEPFGLYGGDCDVAYCDHGYLNCTEHQSIKGSVYGLVGSTVRTFNN